MQCFICKRIPGKYLSDNQESKLLQKEQKGIFQKYFGLPSTEYL
jgi:hypothetical protein